jgi:hypothetical protein
VPVRLFQDMCLHTAAKGFKQAMGNYCGIAVGKACDAPKAFNNGQRTSCNCTEACYAPAGCTAVGAELRGAIGCQQAACYDGVTCCKHGDCELVAAATPLNKQFVDLTLHGMQLGGCWCPLRYRYSSLLLLWEGSHSGVGSQLATHAVRQPLRGGHTHKLVRRVRALQEAGRLPLRPVLRTSLPSRCRCIVRRWKVSGRHIAWHANVQGV